MQIVDNIYGQTHTKKEREECVCDLILLSLLSFESAKMKSDAF
jgi:hypothetical protein